MHDGAVPWPTCPRRKSGVSFQNAVAFDLDLAAAGISKTAPGGKLDFHALRVTYVSLVLEAGASVKEAQSLARHSNPDLTLNVYGRARYERLAEVTESVGAILRFKPASTPIA